MSSYSVIVTAHNMAGVIRRTLQSVETSVQVFQQSRPDAADSPGQIVVVDDGSTDNTWAAIEAQAAGKPQYRLVRHRAATSAACACNAGVNASWGTQPLGPKLRLGTHFAETPFPVRRGPSSAEDAKQSFTS